MMRQAVEFISAQKPRGTSMLSLPWVAASGFTITCASAMRMASRASVARTFIGTIFHRALDRHWRRPTGPRSNVSVTSTVGGDFGQAGGLARAPGC